MSATVSPNTLGNLHDRFAPVWTASRQFREGLHKGQPTVPKKRYAKYTVKRDYVDPGAEELRNIVVHSRKTVHRVVAGQSYESATNAAYNEEHPPLVHRPGDWFPDVSQVYLCKRRSIDTRKLENFCALLEKLPYFLKAMAKIKESWLQNTYPLPMRIVRALDRDDFELISTNFTWPLPLENVNQIQREFWMLRGGDRQVDQVLDARASTAAVLGQRSDSAPVVANRRMQTRRDALASTGTAICLHTIPLKVVAHRKQWNQLVRQYQDDQVRLKSYSAPAGGKRMSLRERDSTAVPYAGSAATQVPTTASLGSRRALNADASTKPATSGVVLDRAAGMSLLDPLYPIWQLVQDMEMADRQILDLDTTNAENAKLVMARCKEIKAQALQQLDRQYKAKIAKVVDNTQTRYRRKVSHLAPPYRTVGKDMAAIRRRVQRDALREDVVVRNAAWFSHLHEVMERIGAGEQLRCRQLLQQLQPLGRLDGSRFDKGKEKLCLLLMSLPYFEALTAGVQLAVLYLHVQLMGGRELVFRQWLKSRRLVDHTLENPIYRDLFVAQYTAGDDNSSQSAV